MPLPRRLGLLSAIAIVVGTTIGSGIFRSPAGVANRLPGPFPMLSVWVVGGLFAMCGALTLAEVASGLPKTGGFYAFVRAAWGDLAGFLFGWSQLLIIRAAAIGAIALPFAEYFMRALGYDPGVAPYSTYTRFIAVGAITVTAGLNVLGSRVGAGITGVMTLAKYGGLIFIVVLALAVGLPRTGGHFTPMSPPGSFAVGPFGLALVSALWAYDGWGDLTFVGGEITDPKRNLPRALIGGTLAVIAIYLLANVAYLSVLSVDQIRTSKLVAADAVQTILGRPGVIFVAITVMLSTFGTLSGSLLTMPRIFFALAEDGLFFKKVAAVHPKYETPWVAIGLVALLGAVFVMARTFEQLADTYVTAMLPFYGLGVASVFRLRRRPDWDPGFRVPLYPFVPILFLLSVVYLLVNTLTDPSSRLSSWIIVLVVLLGIPAYYMTVGRGRAKQSQV